MAKPPKYTPKKCIKRLKISQKYLLDKTNCSPGPLTFRISASNEHQIGQHTIKNTYIIHQFEPMVQTHIDSRICKMLYTGKKNSERIIDVIESPKTPTLTLKNIICHLTQQAQLIKYLIQHVTQKESILEREYDQF